MGNAYTRVKLMGKTVQTTKAFDLTGRYKLCKVLYIHDGDSLFVALRHRRHTWKVTVRLYGINAAELRPDKDTPDRQRIVTKAARDREALRTKILHRRIIIEFHEQDRYGRWLGTIYTESWGKRRQNVNDWMVQQGHAMPFFEGVQASSSPTDVAYDKDAVKYSHEMISLERSDPHI